MLHQPVTLEQHANALVDAIVNAPVGAAIGSKRPPFSIPADVAHALMQCSDASRDYNLSRLIWAHTWAANANAFGFVPHWRQVPVIREFDVNHAAYMATARAALDDALADLRRAT